VVIAGEVDVIVGDERRRVTAGSLAVVTGVSSANTIVSVFDDEWVPYGTRVLGTPAPAEARATA
jgi:hypothetical protein